VQFGKVWIPASAGMSGYGNFFTRSFAGTNGLGRRSNQFNGMPAFFTTSDQRTTSFAICAPNSAGGVASTS
jgi:hypothetical protein